MPFIVPFIPLISAAVGAAGLGKSIYDTVSGGGGGGSSSQSSDAAAAAQAAKDAQAQKAQAIRATSPEAQSQVGGALTDSSFAQLVASMTGNAGDGNLAKSTLFPHNVDGLSDMFSNLSDPTKSAGGISGGDTSGGSGGGAMGLHDYSLTEPAFAA